MITLLLLAVLTAWAFAPRFLSGSERPGLKRLARLLQRTGRYVGIAWLIVFIVAMFHGIQMFAAMGGH